MSPNYVPGKWICTGTCKDLIALNVAHCSDGTFKCLYCRKPVRYYCDTQLTQEQFRKRFGYVPN